MVATKQLTVQYMRSWLHERVIQQGIKTRVQHGDGNIQMWGCFALSGVSNLHMINHTLTTE